MAYGYGLTVTPLQIAAALAAIGNHGIYHEPRIVDAVVDADGTRALHAAHGESAACCRRRSPTRCCRSSRACSTRARTAAPRRTIDVPGFRVRRQDRHRVQVRSGDAPLRDRPLPGVVRGARADRSSAARDRRAGRRSDAAACTTAARCRGPAFATIASESLRYLGVPGEKLIPRDAEGHALIKMDVWGTPLADAQGNWIPVDPPKPTPAPAPVIDRARRAAAGRRRATADAVTVPDFRGMGVGRALDLAREQHLAIEIAGSGRVTSQDHRPVQPRDRFTELSSPSSIGNSRPCSHRQARPKVRAHLADSTRSSITWPRLNRCTKSGRLRVPSA